MQVADLVKKNLNSIGTEQARATVKSRATEGTLSFHVPNSSRGGQDGKEVRMHVDKTTESIGSFKQGDRIEAKVNDKNHALSIRSTRGTDSGKEMEAGRDSLHETDANHGK